MNDQRAGLSQDSINIITHAFSLLMVVYLGLGFLVTGKFINPMTFAILAAVCMAIVVSVVAYFVIHKDGWGAILSS
jgi:hypothetical protein